MKDKRQRRVLNEAQTHNSYDSSDLNSYKEANYRQDIDRNYGSRKIKKKKKSVFARILFLITFLISIFFVGFIFAKSIFILRHRLLITAMFLVIFMILLWIIKSRRKFFLNILSIVIMLFMIISQILFFYFYTKVSSQMPQTNRENVEAPKEYNRSEAYNVYISGLDVDGDISTISRSDVNIILSINLNKGKAMLTTVPRDSYLPIAGGGNDEYDKLTHAGIYGVKSSMDTLANAFSIDMPYYAKVNFTSFIKIVDKIGGIDIYNDEEFVSKVSGKSYPVGNLHLDGSGALDFVRERYGLQDGDLARGRNQQKVLKAVFDKLATPKSIFNFSEILEVITDSVSTNIPVNQLFNIASSYVISGGIEMESQKVEGYNDFLPSYAMPDYDLFMYVLYDESVEEVRKSIEELLD